MQIHSISGENIASLAAPFEIKLDEAPLSSAGLFAITGETGAGKSSLLDTMCLALYGDCPRLSGDGTRENVEDVDGQELRSNDPRTTLRRGAAKAIARVVFRGVDGEIYAVEWMVRRAREKPDGRLQNVERSLMRLSDRQVLATQLTIVNERIVELTGLTYDEFRRTTLLAQGDFDAFLVAKTGDRAAILEKVTGTGIYRDISRKVYERYAETRRALEILEARRGEHRLLTPEDRQALADEIDTLRTTQKAKDNELKQILAEIAVYIALEEAQANLEKAQFRLNMAQNALQARSDDKARLADWDSARGLRGEVKEREAAVKAHGDIVTIRDGIVDLRDAHTEILKTAGEEAATARAARDEAETVFKSFALDWTRATTLDGNIATATEEAAKAEKQLNSASSQVSEAKRKYEAFEGRKKALEVDIEIEAAKLAKVPGHETLLGNWALLEGRLHDRIACATELASWEEEKTSLSDSIAVDRENTKTCTTGIQMAGALIKVAHGEQDEIAEERATLIEVNPTDRLARLSQVASDLRDLRNAATDARTAQDAIAKSVKRISDAGDAQAEASKKLDAAGNKVEEAGHQVDALRRPMESADAAVTREAAHLRRHLHDGEPCPVCRSTTHPVMQDGALAELAKGLREQFEATAKMKQAALDDARAAERVVADAEMIIAEEKAARSGLEARLARAIEAFGTARRVLENAPLSDKLPDDPEVPEEVFNALFETVAAWRGKLEANRDRLGVLEKTHGEAVRAIEEQNREIIHLQSVEREISGRMAGYEARIATLGESITSAGKTISQIDNRVGSILAEIGLLAESFGPNSENHLEKLGKISETLVAARDKIAEHKTTLVDLGPEIGRTAADMSGAAKAETEAKEHRNGRVETLKALVDERAGLLGGEATDTHRTRHNEARTKAQAALEQADRTYSEENAKLVGIESRFEAAGTTVATAETRLSNAEAALTDACSAAGLLLERVVELHKATDEEMADCRERIRQAETEKANADGALKERQDALRALKDEGLPERPRDELDAIKRQLEIAAQARGEELGRLAGRQSADFEARKRLQDLEQEIDAARGASDTWLAINEVIGAANGDRFAQIAQAVTLGLLVERANLHLQELKPRYRLEVAASDLALHVIDLDMAGERRTTRSLSGGERFLVSLALALALSSMGTHGALAGTLFIDEGFGSLDSDSLDLAIDALERLHAQGRTIGVISHVQAMKDRVPVQIEVAKTGGGASELRLKVA